MGLSLNPAVGAESNKTVETQRRSGMWVLECGAAQPYWKLDVLPEWIRGKVGQQKTGMPILFKRQQHGPTRNLALKTYLKAANPWNRVEMTVTFTQNCHSTLTKSKVSFAVIGTFNDQPLTGCCRALKVP